MSAPYVALAALADLQIQRDEEHGDRPDTHRNAPRPDPACLYGLVGDVALAGSENTEANPYAVALNFMVYLSAALGRGSFTPVGNTWHHPRQFGLHVGRSGRGRKGDAASLIHRIDMAVRTANEDAAPQVHRGGLSTREGLALMIHDGWAQGKDEVPPIHDKRLCVFESEFANILAQGKRDGNTLSSALRDAWDGVSIKPATKSNRVWASNPHIGLMGAVTPNELRVLMASRELTNGFANRFLIIWAERIKVLPFPQATPEPVVDDLARRVVEVIEFAGGLRFVDRDVQRIELTTAAKARYARLYLGELNDQSDGELIGALMERRAPVLLRLAMLFALVDLTRDVGVPHIDAALAWVRYWRESVKFIFSSAVDEDGTARTNETAERIVGFLKARDKATRKQITVECFQSHANKGRIDAALDELLAATPPRIVVDTVERPKGSPGTPTRIYSLTANSANSAECEYPCGSAPDFTHGKVCELSELSPATVHSVRTVCNPSNSPESRADTHALHSSQSLQASDESEAF